MMLGRTLWVSGELQDLGLEISNFWSKCLDGPTSEQAKDTE